MELQINIPDVWKVFSYLFGWMLITSFIIFKISEQFYLKNGGVRKFSILEFQFPSSRLDLINLISSVYNANSEEKPVKALKKHLWVDFLFMPGIYGCIFILCMNVAGRMQSDIGRMGFAIFAWLQFLCWIFDIYENLYLLNRISKHKSDVEETKKLINQDSNTDCNKKREIKEKSFSPFLLYVNAVRFKWIIALLGGICSINVLLYYFLNKQYNTEHLWYLLVLIGEIALIIIFKKLMPGKNVMPQ